MLNSSFDKHKNNGVSLVKTPTRVVAESIESVKTVANAVEDNSISNVVSMHSTLTKVSTCVSQILAIANSLDDITGLVDNTGGVPVLYPNLQDIHDHLHELVTIQPYLEYLVEVSDSNNLHHIRTTSMHMEGIQKLWKDNADGITYYDVVEQVNKSMDIIATVHAHLDCCIHTLGSPEILEILKNLESHIDMFKDLLPRLTELESDVNYLISLKPQITKILADWDKFMQEWENFPNDILLKVLNDTHPNGLFDMNYTVEEVDTNKVLKVVCTKNSW